MKCSKCGFDIPGDSGTCTRCGTPILKRGLTPTRYLKEDFEETQTFTYSPGDSFGDRYRIVEEIGRGGMGKVYKAWDKELDIHVAIKMIHPELLSKPDTIARFKKEIRIAREITHENVVRIYDFGEVDAVKFISMQYIDGKNLAELIHSSGPLGIETAISVAKQICYGLKAAHKQDFIHRDLKPQNIMIDQNGKVYITDFGLAKSMEEHGISASGIVMGTPQYLSPEQAMGEKADHRSDIYMLGIIMYEMMTGKELFTSETVIGYLQKHIQQKPTSPSTINYLIPPFFEKIILKCLEKEKSKRYRNVDELLKDLQKEKVTTGPIIFKGRSRRILKRIAAVSILFAAIASIIYLFITGPLPGSTDGRISVAIMNPKIMMGDKQSEQLGKTIQSLLITDLGQSPYFRVLPDNQLYDILKSLNKLNENNYSKGILEQVADRGNVDYIIKGKYTKVDKNSRFDLEIWKKGIKIPIYAKVKGNEGDDIFAFVDKITLKIKDKFFPKKVLPDDIDEQIGKITTTSPLAYKYYLEGKRYYWEGKYEESNEEFKKAIRLDPKFAMAYMMIASNCSYLGQFAQTLDNLRIAFDFKTRASERERYLIEAYYYKITKKSLQSALNTYQKLLDRYPNDEEGITEIGAIYRNQEEWNMAEEQFKRLLKINSSSEAAHLNLVFIYFSRGFHTQAENLLQNNRKVFSKLKCYHQNMAKLLLSKKEYELALMETKKAISMDPEEEYNIELKGYIYQSKGDFKKAESTYSELIDSDEPKAQSIGRLLMSNLFLIYGNYEKSIKEIEQGIAVCAKSSLEEGRLGFLLYLTYIYLRLNNPETAHKTLNQTFEIDQNFDFIDSFTIRKISLHFLGWTFLQKKKIKEAKDTARQLQQLIIDTGSEKKMRLYFHLMGLISLEEEQNLEAIEYFNKALLLLPNQVNVWDNTTFYLEPLATAYHKINNLEKAKEVYAKIQNSTIGNLRWGDIYSRSFYWQGKISQKLKMHKEAKANYNEFLRLRKDETPQSQETKDVLKQLEILN